MGSDEFVYKETWISDLVERNFLSLFKRTRNLHNDYWYIWAKSGLLDFICLKLRDKYQIPILDEKIDYESGEIYISDKSVTVDKHIFYDNWENKEQFRKEIESLIIQLRLHHSTFGSLFNKIFYNTPLDIKEKWEGFNTESVFHITKPIAEEFLLVGFTKREVVKIRGMILSQLTKELKRLPNKNETKAIDNWYEELKRNIRVVNNKKLIYLVVEQMKKYKTYTKGFDDNHDWSDRLRHTSEKCAANIYAELRLPKNKKFEAIHYRKMAQRLYEQFPVLREFISKQ